MRIDLIITVMTGFARRFIHTYEPGSAFDLFMGTRDWIDLKDRANHPHFTRDLLDIYTRQLASIGYMHTDDLNRILNAQGSPIYHLVFASKHERGLDFFEKISRTQPGGQRRLSL